MSDKPRICLLCKHFDIESAEPAYSSWTPGTSFSMECRKDLWFFDSYDTTRDEYRRMMLTAVTCPHFEAVDLESERSRS